MSGAPEVEGVTDTRGWGDESGGPVRSGRPAWVVALAQACVIVACFAAAGLLAGWLWFHTWTPGVGTVFNHRWALADRQGYYELPALRAQFGATVSFLGLATLFGLPLGLVLSRFLQRSELATLAAVLIGAVLAGWLMGAWGTHLGPPDPDLLARTRPDGTRLPEQLVAEGLVRHLVWPMAALAGLVIAFVLPARPAPGDH